MSSTVESGSLEGPTTATWAALEGIYSRDREAELENLEVFGLTPDQAEDAYHDAILAAATGEIKTNPDEPQASLHDYAVTAGASAELSASEHEIPSGDTKVQLENTPTREPGPGDAIVGAAVVAMAMERLDPDEVTVMAPRIQIGMTQVEVASATGVGLNQTKHHQRTAIAKLQRWARKRDTI